MMVWYFLDLSEFTQILGLKTFGDSWSTSYIPCLLLIITFRFTFSGKKFGKVSKIFKVWCPPLSTKLYLISIVENRDRLAGIYFILLKKRRGPKVKVFRHKFRPQWKDWKSSFQERQNLALCYNLVPLILRWNLVKGLIVIKFIKKFKFEVVWSELEAKHCLKREPWTKYLRKTLNF